MSKRRRRYTETFKCEVCLRLETSPDVAALASELGISRSMLYRWHRSRSANGSSALPMPDLAEVFLAGEPAVDAAPVAPLAAAAPVAPEAAGTETLSGSVLRAAQRRVVDLERKIGQQQLALDFFRAALRHVREHRLQSAAPGATVSTP